MWGGKKFKSFQELLKNVVLVSSELLLLIKSSVMLFLEILTLWF